MSAYENYGTISASYDKTRIPIGLEIIVGCFAQIDKDLAEMVVLDAGCGTGSYSVELLRFVDRIHAVDINAGMLGRAKSKFAESDDATRIEFHQAGLEHLPFEDGSFDGITVNQVLHHLDDRGAKGWPKHEETIRSLARTLKPGGALVVNTCSREQVHKGYWPNALIPDAAARMSDCYMPIDELEHLMRDCGLNNCGRFVPVDAVFQGKAYFDPRGPLNKEWRDGDSTWTLASEPELEGALKKLRDLDRLGEMEAFVARHDAQRCHVGQVTFLFARRSSELLLGAESDKRVGRRQVLRPIPSGRARDVGEASLIQRSRPVRQHASEGRN